MLLEEAFYPNWMPPPRPIYKCPERCFGEDQFFGLDGTSYDDDDNCKDALM